MEKSPLFEKIFFMKDYVAYLYVPYPISLKRFNYMNKNSELNSHKEHDAFIYISPLRTRKIFVNDGIDLLVKFFSERKYPYRVYYCKNIEEFKTVLKNPKTLNLWIFSHGHHGGISCGKTKLNYYEEFSLINTPAKKYIYQFHCNDGDSPSLLDILSMGRGFSTNDVLTLGDIRAYIKQILKDFNA